MKQIKRILVVVVGGSVLALGVALIVLPGPAFLVIPLGLAILAAEFAWARRWLRSAKALSPFGCKRNPGAPSKRPTFRSIRRSLEFLLRQARRTLAGKRNAMNSHL